MSRLLNPRIHARGAAGRLDAVLELAAYAARPRPLSLTLDELPRRIARVFGADVCSIYLLEGDDLVMRGNVGFRPEAVGEVRLGVGEGITGLAVEYVRPISLDAAPTHASYRHFPGLGEEHFPIFLAIPVSGPRGVLGALVLQRRDPPSFVEADIELAAALTMPIAAAAQRAQLVDALKGKRAIGRGSRRVTLSGHVLAPGRALGAICMLPRLPSRAAAGSAAETSSESPLSTLNRVTAGAIKTLDALSKRSGLRDAVYVHDLRTILQDARIGERAVELCSQGRTLWSALTQVGVEALRVANQVGEPFGQQRALLLSEACEALAMLSMPGGRVDLPRSAVLIGDRFSAFDLLVSLRAQPAAVALSDAPNEPSRLLLQGLSLPVVTEVAGLFRWAESGELALVDADHGLVRLNPSRSEITSLRAEKRQR